MVPSIDWNDGYEEPPRESRLWKWLRRKRPAPAPQFPTPEQLAWSDVATTTCVCHRLIARWPYPGQGPGTAGDEHWWVHIGDARRRHTRDTLSPDFWPGVNQEPYAKPVWQR